MKRLIAEAIRKDLKSKIILLTGPRQCGKTTLAKMLTTDPEYLNYDEAGQRVQIQKKIWDRDKDLLILDELHKMPKWKGWLKGLYDTEGLKIPIVVTGSAKMDAYKKVGDSLAGRFFSFRLHPLDVKEILADSPKENAQNVLERLLRVGGFPEPYLKGETGYYNRWRKSHLDIILRQDLIDLETVQNIVQMETLIQFLRTRIGSPLSYSSLAEDLRCNDKTLKRWLVILENLYVIFKVTPYHKNIARSLLKQPKYYFYDIAQVEGDEGIRLENAVACALLKEIQYRSDVEGEQYQLHYLRNKTKQEVDFFVTKNGKPHLLLEAKTSDAAPHPHLEAFAKALPSGVHKVQLVKNLTKETSYPSGLKVKRAADWLSKLDL